MKIKSFLSILLIMLFSAMFVFAGGDKESEPDKEPIKVLRVGVSSFAWRLDPAVRYSNNTAQMHINMHDGLVRLTPDEVPFRVLPSVAESWEEVSPTEVDFKIRKGVKFWDGSLVTAEDVAWSINRSLRVDHPRYKSYAGRWAYNFKEVEIIDPMTVRVHLKRPDPLKYVMLAQTPASILSKKGFEAAADPDSWFKNPIGCGPYRIAEYKKDQYLKLEKWDDY